jgi:hypothetical protein
MLNEVIRYFDLQSERRSVAPAGQAKAAPGARRHAPVLPQYGAVSLGVLVEPFLQNYIASGTFDVDFAGALGRTGFALLIAITLLPAVYKNAFDPDKPIVVQLCALFVSGLGWQSLFQTAVAAASGGQ